jgi:uncharacterized protein (DUF433 family)
VPGLRFKKENDTVAFTAQSEAPPLREDAAGALRVGDSRVLLELVIRAFQDGATPETFVQRYSTLALPDVYAVIAYYLRHRSEIEEYLARRKNGKNGKMGRVAVGITPHSSRKSVRAQLRHTARPTIDSRALCYLAALR